MDDMEDTPYKLFVGQVPMHMTAEHLRPTFERFGKIEEITIIIDKTTRLSKGCGFVTYTREDAARAAIEALSDKCILAPGSKPLVVKFAEGLQQKMEEKTLYVALLPTELNEEQLTELFAPYGELRQVRLIRRPEDNVSKGIAHIRYAKRSEASAAVSALNGYAGLHGSQRPLFVRFFASKDAGQPSAAETYPGYSMHHTYMPAMGHMGMPMHMAPYVQLPQPMAPPYPAPRMHDAQGHKLFVGMIPFSTGEVELQAVFSQFGPLMEVFMMREKDGRSKGCAFVRFYTKHAADAACATLNGTMSLPGAARALVVKYADASEPRGSPMAIPQHGGRASYGHKPPMPAPPHMMGAASYSPAMSMPMGDQQWMGMATSPNAILASSPPGAVPMQLGMQCMGVVPNMPGMAQVGVAPAMASHYGATGMEAMGIMPHGMAAFAMQPGHQMQQYMAHYSQPHMEPHAMQGDQAHMQGAHMLSHHQMGLPHPPQLYAQHHGGPPTQADQSSGLERQMVGLSLYPDDGGVGSWERLYVSNLARGTTEQDLQHMFSPFGQLKEIQLLRRVDGSSKGSAFVAFGRASEGYAASCALNKTQLGGDKRGARPLCVKPSTSHRRPTRTGGVGGLGLCGGGGASASGGGGGGGCRPASGASDTYASESTYASFPHELVASQPADAREASNGLTDDAQASDSTPLAPETPPDAADAGHPSPQPASVPQT